MVQSNNMTDNDKHYMSSVMGTMKNERDEPDDRL